MSARLTVTQNFQVISRSLLSVGGMVDYNSKIKKQMVQTHPSMNSILGLNHEQS